MKKNEKNNLCPVGEALKVIGGKWSLQIINEIGKEKRRFGEMKRLIPDISEKMLIQELKKLVSYDVLNRKAYPEIPPKVEYSLTEYGKKIIPIIVQIKTFGFEMIEKTTANKV
ncbi:MAG: helix-turn-helix transcriptional regulator [Flavobacteriaceae bacterium]|nr:helix-turn-helix transcriptional regulator [Flavobacteriaceae bacterium]